MAKQVNLSQEAYNLGKSLMTYGDTWSSLIIRLAGKQPVSQPKQDSNILKYKGKELRIDPSRKMVGQVIDEESDECYIQYEDGKPDMLNPNIKLRQLEARHLRGY